MLAVPSISTPGKGVFPTLDSPGRHGLSPIPRKMLFSDALKATNALKTDLARELSFERSDSPPYKRVKSFKASTPFVCRKNTTPSTPPPATVTTTTTTTTLPLLSSPGSNTPPGNPSLLRFAETGNTTPTKDMSLLSLSALAATPKVSRSRDHDSVLDISKLKPPTNPFTPDGRKICAAYEKRRKSLRASFNSSVRYCREMDEEDYDMSAENIRIKGSSLTCMNTPRFAQEFKVEDLFASGSFGQVFKCCKFTDGIVYAIKKSQRPLNNKSDEIYARRELFVNGALESHIHIVRYLSSWYESNHLYIQMEYCNGGNLEQLIENKNHAFTEMGVRRVAAHLSSGLRYLHRCGIAHMDIKPSNVMIVRTEHLLLTSDDESDESDREDTDLIYKIGDLGHAVPMDLDTGISVAEGDSRYMAKELLQENFQHLDKADIFSFGLTLYHAASGGPIPQNGDAWHKFRDGNSPYLYAYSSRFNQMIKGMLHPNPTKRPSAKAIRQDAATSCDKAKQEEYVAKCKRDVIKNVCMEQMKNDLPVPNVNLHSPDIL